MERVTPRIWKFEQSSNFNVRSVTSHYISQTYFWDLLPPHLNFLPANHDTQIWLGGTLTLISAFKLIFSTPVSLSYGVGNMKKKIFVTPKNCGRGLITDVFGWIISLWALEYTVIVLNLIDAFFLSQDLYQNFSIIFFFWISTPTFMGDSGLKEYFDAFQCILSSLRYKITPNSWVNPEIIWY